VLPASCLKQVNCRNSTPPVKPWLLAAPQADSHFDIE
jgi:hypothetical protein